MKKIITVGEAPALPYSTAVTAGGLVYLSGTFALGAGRTLLGAGDVAAQTRIVIEKMQATLQVAGSSLDQVLSVMVYLQSASDFAAMNAAYKTFWPKDPPTRTTVVTDLVVPGGLVEMSMVAAAAGGERTVIHPPSWLASPNPYSYAIKSGDIVFLSGMVSRSGRDNQPVTGDVATETRTIMDGAGEILAAAGLTHADIVSAKVFLTDGSTFEQMNGAYRTYFPSAPPARATVLTALASSQYSVEITLVASSAPREVINAPATTNPNLSPGIKAGGRCYLSGVLGNTPDNRDVTSQTRETLSRIRMGLTAAGATPADVVEAIVYLTDLQDFAAMNAEYGPFFGRDYPARATVRTGLVAPDGVVEIMMTAVTR